MAAVAEPVVGSRSIVVEGKTWVVPGNKSVVRFRPENKAVVVESDIK